MYYVVETRFEFTMLHYLETWDTLVLFSCKTFEILTFTLTLKSPEVGYFG